MKSYGDRLYRADRLLRRALLSFLVAVGLTTGLAVLAAPEQSYELLQGLLASGGGRMVSRYREVNGTAGQVVAPEWSTDGQYQTVSGFWSRDAFIQVYPTPRPTPAFHHISYMPWISAHHQ